MNTMSKQASPKAKIDKLVREQTRWQRKLAVATNKLADIRRKMDKELFGV
jgi:hypothetical protein